MHVNGSDYKKQKTGIQAGKHWYYLENDKGLNLDMSQFKH